MELVYVSIISGIFSIVIVTMLQKFWIQKWRMNFDFEKYKVRQRNRGKAILKNPAPASLAGNVAGLIPILKNLTPEQIDLFKSFVSGETEEGEEVDSGIDGLIKFAESNPELVKNFLGGLSSNTGDKPKTY